MMGLKLPAVEFVIALSMVLLGAALAMNRKQPLAVPLSAAAVFGFFHGYAHGTEMPSLTAHASYAIGFVLATTTLHIVGIVVGL
jgi:urease accessory protein